MIADPTRPVDIDADAPPLQRDELMVEVPAAAAEAYAEQAVTQINTVANQQLDVEAEEEKKE